MKWSASCNWDNNNLKRFPEQNVKEMSEIRFQDRDMVQNRWKVSNNKQNSKCNTFHSMNLKPREKQISIGTKQNKKHNENKSTKVVWFKIQMAHTSKFGKQKYEQKRGREREWMCISSLTIFHLARSGDYKNGLVIPILFRIISKIIMTVFIRPEKKDGWLMVFCCADWKRERERKLFVFKESKVNAHRKKMEWRKNKWLLFDKIFRFRLLYNWMGIIEWLGRDGQISSCCRCLFPAI